MDIRAADEILYLNNGAGGIYEIPIREVSTWKLVLEENRALYLSFSLDGCTQKVSVLSGDSSKLKSTLAKLIELLKSEPVLDLRRAKVPTDLSWIAREGLLISLPMAFSGC